MRRAGRRVRGSRDGATATGGRTSAPVAAERVLEHIERDADVIVAMANGEAVGLL
jgi:hypothetical protein